MKNQMLILTVVLLLAGVGSQAGAESTVYPAGDALLQEMEQALFPESYRMRMEMNTIESNGRERPMELSVWYRRGTGSYMEIEAPARSRGTRFLQREDSLWMFVPRSNSRNAIRLSGRDSFQGSVFSNRDIGESMYTEDYRASVSGRGSMNHPELGEINYYIVEMLPRHDAAAYGRVIAHVEVESNLPISMQYFVRAGMKIKEMHFSDIQEIAGRKRPLRMEMISLEEEGKRSIVQILELEADNALPDRIFTQQHLTR
ncbi:outer membrane lipoprotein-sorting protein [Spirochaeta dissipatitropha]